MSTQRRLYPFPQDFVVSRFWSTRCIKKTYVLFQRLIVSLPRPFYVADNEQWLIFVNGIEASRWLKHEVN